MITAEVIKENDELSIKLIGNFKVPYWMNINYNIKEEIVNGFVILKCRPMVMTVTQPIVEKTPMGIMTRTRTFNMDKCFYFDIPYKSLLIDESTDMNEIVKELELEEYVVEQITEGVNE